MTKWYWLLWKGESWEWAGLRGWPPKVTNKQYKSQECFKGGFTLDSIPICLRFGGRKGGVLVSNSLVYGKTRQRWQSWGRITAPVHRLAQTVSQILTACKTQGLGADCWQGGPHVGVRLHLASYRKPNHIELHSKGDGSAWVTDMSWENQTLYMAWSRLHLSSGILLTCLPSLYWLPTG